MNARFEPSGPLRGEIAAPPDKSISHRAALIGAMASEPVRIDNYLKAADTKATLQAARALGALVEVHLTGVVVRGSGLREAREPEQPIDVGNAGTLMRILPGWLAGQEGRSFTLQGDSSIARRPVDRVIEPLRAMGAKLTAREGRYPPLRIGGARLEGISYELPVASAQVKSCVLLGGLLASGRTAVIERLPSRDHTERMLLAAGARVERSPVAGAGTQAGVAGAGDAPGHAGAVEVTICHADELVPGRIVVPGDASSAAFLIAAGVLVKGSRLVIRDVGVNWTRTGFLRILKRMGAIVLGDLEPVPQAPAPAGPARGERSQAQGGVGALVAQEPASDLDVAAGPLEGTVVEPAEVPLAIDELPLVALLGCFAEGETVVRGASELRVKESDRIATVVDGLRSLGAGIEPTDDGFAVHGSGGLRGGTLDAHGDHRLAMLGAVAGLASQEGVEVRGIEAAAVSYPRFSEDLRSLLER
jgi:3-phosphoshikimate 1-carboxyvinyltransferase